MTSESDRNRKTFTGEQLKRYKKAFDVYDLNKNGQIECGELYAIARYLGYRLSETHIIKIIQRLDLDERGVINFEEFLRAMPGNTEVLSEEEHRKALYRQKFQEYDSAGAGHVTCQDAERVLREELRCPASQLHTLLSQFHVDSDKQAMSYEDFVDFYCKVKEDIKKAFREFDRDNKGYVSFEDAQRIMAEYGFSDAELTSLFNAHDRNRDNLLNYEEFVTFWGPLV